MELHDVLDTIRGRRGALARVTMGDHHWAADPGAVEVGLITDVAAYPMHSTAPRTYDRCVELEAAGQVFVLPVEIIDSIEIVAYEPPTGS